MYRTVGTLTCLTRAGGKDEVVCDASAAGTEGDRPTADSASSAAE